VATSTRSTRSTAKTIADFQILAPQKSQKVEIPEEGEEEEPKEIDGDSDAKKSSTGQHTSLSLSAV
jgi:hypothetical protein